MTKEEKIKEAWGNLWNNFNDTAKRCALKHGGFISPVLENTLNQDYTEWCDKTKAWRPKSLQGIENNNGWIKIESEADLIIESETYVLVNSNKGIEVLEYVDNGSVKGFIRGGDNYILRFNELCITHYQPIEKPKPPIY